MLNISFTLSIAIIDRSTFCVHSYILIPLNGSTIGGNKSVLELKAKELKEDISTLETVKGQSIEVLAKAIKKRPKTLTDITKAVRIAVGEAPPKPQIERNRERSR